MTYLEAMSALQQRGLDALKVAQATQLTSLATTRDCATALTESSLPALLVPAVVSDMTALMTSFAFQVLEQQVAYAKQLADALATMPTTNLPAPDALPIASTSEVISPSPTPTAPVPVVSSQVMSEPLDAHLAATTADPYLPVSNADEGSPIVAIRQPGAEAWLDYQTIAAEQTDALSKALPAPSKSAANPGPRLNTDGAMKKPKIPSVSSDRPGKRGSTPK